MRYLLIIVHLRAVRHLRVVGHRRKVRPTVEFHESRNGAKANLSETRVSELTGGHEERQLSIRHSLLKIVHSSTIQAPGRYFCTSSVSLTPPVKEITTTVTRHISSFDL